MRPITLTFKGLRSYRDTTTVDFTDLDLFAIIGDTGAGKSTILEALSLALYARKSWSGGGTSLADMICDGVNTMSIELTFHANDHTWIVTRARHRNAAAPIDKLVSTTGGGTNVDGARQVNDAIAQLIGLSHEQFTRAVVLPQGRFDELLRATERERTEILSSILGLGDVTITRQTVQRLLDQWRPKTAVIIERRRRYPDDPQATLQEATKRADVLRQRLTALDTALAAAIAADAAAQTAENGLTRIRKDLMAVPAAPDLDPADELLRLHELGLALAKRAADADEQTAEADRQLTALDVRATTLLAGLVSRDGLVELRTKLADIAVTIDDQLDDLEECREAVANLQAVDLSDYRIDELATAHRAAVAATEIVVNRYDEHTRHLSLARDRWVALNAARTSLQRAAAEHTTAGNPIAELQVHCENAKHAVSDADHALATAQAAERDALLQDAAATAAAACSPGDACPVCAQTIPTEFRAPAPADHTAITEQVDDARSALKTSRSQLSAANRAADLADGKLAAAAAALDAAQVALETAEADARAADIDVTNCEESAALQSFVKASAALDEELAIARAAEDVARNQLNVATANMTAQRDTHARHLADANRRLASAEQTVTARQAVLDAIVETWRPGALSSSASQNTVERIDGALRDLEAVDNVRRGISERRSGAQTSGAGARNAISTDVMAPAGRTVHAVNIRSARINDLCESIKVASRDNGLDAADLDLPSELDEPTPDQLDMLAALAEDTGRSADLILTAADATLESIGRLATDAATELRTALDCVGIAEINELREVRGRACSDHETAMAAAATAASDAEAAAKLDGVVAIAEPFVANLEVLTVCLRDTNFVSHLVSIREAELLAEATRRLKAITGDRFGFSPGFGIVNTRSGETRSPDALSGGERFQAALALALALVEIASRGAGTLDAVFVDEGFGSLDSASLDVALETLGTVAGGGKMVALISHLRPVAEYVDTVLHVTRDDLLGSRIALLDAEDREQLLADDIRSGLTA